MSSVLSTYLEENKEFFAQPRYYLYEDDMAMDFAVEESESMSVPMAATDSAN